MKLKKERLSQMESIQKMKYRSALKRKKILPHVITRMNLEDLMLSERRQSQKDKHRIDSTYKRHLEWSNALSQEAGSRLSGAGGRENREMFSGWGFALGG